MNRFDLRTAIAIALTTLLWASAFAGIRVGLISYTPGELALLRFSVASIALLIYGLIAKIPLPKKQDLGAIAFIGLTGITGYHLLLNYGEKTVTAGVASLLVNTAPIFTALLAIAFLKEKLILLQWIGIAISFTGASLIAIGQKNGLQFEPGALLILLSALCMSVFVIAQKPLLKKYGAIALTAYATWFGTLFLLPFLPGLLLALPTVPIEATIAGIYLGIFPTAIGYVTWAYVLSQVPASRATTILYLVPVMAIAIAWILLKEIPTTLSLIGGAIVLSGVILVNSRMRRKP